MNLQNDSIQDVFKNWNDKILSRLPSNLDEMVKSTGILQRKHGIDCVVDLLRMLFSLRQFKFFLAYLGSCRLHA